MANQYRSQRVQTNSLQDLMQLLNYMGGDSKKEDYGELFGYLAEGTKSYDNSEIDYYQGRASEYLDEHRGDMSDVDIEKFEMLDERYIHQKNRNENYNDDYSRFSNRTDTLLGVGDAYNSSWDDESFSWEETATVGGQQISTKHEVNFPDYSGYSGGISDPQFLESNEYKEFMNNVGGIDGYKAKKKEYQIHLKNQIGEEIEGFVKESRIFRNKYGDRLKTSAFSADAMNLEEMNFSYQYFLSALDDDVISSEERENFSNSLKFEDVRYITEFKRKTGEVQKQARGLFLNEMTQLNTMGDNLYAHQKQMDEILELGMVGIPEHLQDQPYLEIPGAVLGQEKPEYITYQQAYDFASIQSPSPEMIADPRYSYITGIDTQLNRVKEQLVQKDDALLKNSGASFINTMVDDEWLDDITVPVKGFAPSAAITKTAATQQTQVSPQSSIQPVAGSPAYKQQQQQAVKAGASQQVQIDIMPDVTLKTKDRGDTIKYGWLDKNRETMYTDVEKIVDIIGGVGKPGDISELESLAYKHGLIDGLHGLQKIIDQYGKIKHDTSKKNRIAIKILTRYNTILDKFKKRMK